MRDAKAVRLDIGDIAEGAGWKLESMSRIDEFSKDGVTVMVQYGAGGEIESLTRSRAGRPDEVYGAESAGKAERLRTWLGGRVGAAQKSYSTALPDIPYEQDSRYECWTPETFYEAVEDACDRAFLMRLAELVYDNSRLPRRGKRRPLWFGKRLGGAMFVHIFSLHRPPFKFTIQQGQLNIAGSWGDFRDVKGHPGFAPLRSLLGLEATGSATAVPVFGLDADEVWAVGEKVSQTIN